METLALMRVSANKQYCHTQSIINVYMITSTSESMKAVTAPNV